MEEKNRVAAGSEGTKASETHSKHCFEEIFLREQVEKNIEEHFDAMIAIFENEIMIAENLVSELTKVAPK
jgi:hypothetical protein